MRPDITGSFDDRQGRCLHDYPDGLGLAVIHSEADMQDAHSACTTGPCMLGLRWAGDQWKWVDGQSLGGDGRSGGYHRWADQEPEKTSENNHPETTVVLLFDGVEWLWHDSGSLDDPDGTTLCMTKFKSDETSGLCHLHACVNVCAHAYMHDISLSLDFCLAVSLRRPH